MATIEPRLMHLLNDSETRDLPPIQSLPLTASGSQSLSLPPLGSETLGNQRLDRTAPTQIASLSVVSAGRQVKPVARADETPGLLTASSRPLQLLVAEPDATASTVPLPKIVDDVHRRPEDPSTKKRHRALNAKEDFVQLPRLPKKQKSLQQIVPPIIAGLREPPPNAAVFPPITSAPFDDPDLFTVGARKDLSSGAPEDRPIPPSSVVDAGQNNTQKNNKRRAMKPRRKWTEEETNNLLLGVSRHGVGRWTTILEDPDFKFNDRTAGDLKDRFRTCCPEELRLNPAEARSGNGESGLTEASEENTRPRGGLQLEAILIPTDQDPFERDGASPSALGDSDAGPKPRKSRSHRMKLEDLAELGIHGPFEKSHRRKRRPFSKQDDEQILDGLERYGPSWTRIQRDPRYNLSSRQPTDLRDRVRNKYPEIYSSLEKAHLQAKEAARGKVNVLEPSISLSADNLLSSVIPVSLEPQLNRSGSKEDMSRWTTAPSVYESTEHLPALADLLDGSHGTSFFGGAPEMDISNLLLDDSQISSEHHRFGGHDSASIGVLPAGGPPDSRFVDDR